VTIELTKYEKEYILLALTTYAEHHWEPSVEDLLPLTSEESENLVKKLRNALDISLTK
jgi:hypothetical protein